MLQANKVLRLARPSKKKLPNLQNANSQVRAQQLNPDGIRLLKTVSDKFCRAKKTRYYEKLISSVVSYEMYPEWNPECPRRESESAEIAVAVTVAPFICIVVRAGGGEARTKDIR